MSPEQWRWWQLSHRNLQGPAKARRPSQRAGYKTHARFQFSRVMDSDIGLQFGQQMSIHGSHHHSRSRGHGRLAAAFRVRDPQGRFHAERCFTQRAEGLPERYRAYHDFLPKAPQDLCAAVPRLAGLIWRSPRPGSQPGSLPGNDLDHWGPTNQRFIMVPSRQSSFRTSSSQARRNGHRPSRPSSTARPPPQ